MRRSATDRMRRSAVMLLVLLVGALSSVGCSTSRAVREKAAAWLRAPHPEVPAAATRAESSHAIPRLPAVEGPALVDAQDFSPPPLRLPTPPAVESSAAAAAWSWPRECPPAVRLVSDEGPPPSSQTAPAPPTQIARAETRRPQAMKARGVVHADAATFDRHVLRSETPVLVDFYARWCGPCKKLAPALDELAAENPEARVVKVDIDDSPELASRYGVRSVPSLLVFKEGRVVAKENGVVGKSRLRSMLDL